MAHLIDKDALIAEIEKAIKSIYAGREYVGIPSNEENIVRGLQKAEDIIDTLEVKEMDVWKTVDNINPPQADRNKIYCVLTKDRYILATVINHPKDEELLQWKCTDFPNHRYDMCEGDKYMQIV